MIRCPDVAIVGAGPYGLSIAAHLRASGVSFRIFGSPMHTWRQCMPDGMLLKSDGFASNLSDPSSLFTLQRFCQMTETPYDHTRTPVSLETFRAYGLAFQQRMAPDLEDVQVLRVEGEVDGYRLRLSDGESAVARNVVLAIGVTHFGYMPPILQRLPADLRSHSSEHKEVARFRGRDVAVIGAGASAVDLAVLLTDAGANATLVARRPRLRFFDPPGPNGRSLWAILRRPSSPIGPGWRARLYCEAPGLFYRLPRTIRQRIVNGSLAPAPGWPMRERFVGTVPARLGYDIQDAHVADGRAHLLLGGRQGTEEQVADHVIAATGYRIDLRRLTFLSAEIVGRLRSMHHAPLLSPDFESSVPGLYFVGMAAMYEFGPMMRFACGAEWTARRLRRTFARQSARTLAASPAALVSTSPSG